MRRLLGLATLVALVGLLIGCAEQGGEDVTAPAGQVLIGLEHIEDIGLGIDDGMGPSPPDTSGGGAAGGGGGDAG